MTDAIPADSPPVEVTMREITELVAQFHASGASSLELDLGGMHLVLGKNGAPAVATVARKAPVEAPAVAAAPTEVSAEAAVPPAAPPAAAPAAPVASGAELTEVFSPVVGAFWVAPSPGEPPFVQVGDRVDQGQQLGIVEVMKLMSDVSAPVSGVIVEVCVDNAEMVEYDQVLFRIDPGDV